MAINPERYYVQEDGTVVDEDGNTVDLVVPGPSQEEVFDPESPTAAARAAGEEEPVDEDLDRMTHSQLDAYASDRGIDLGDATTKADKVAAIRATEG